jgi:glycosyltransferase involved in cell wall biosynthesis
VNENLIRIAIDGNEANITNRVGSNVYAFEIIKALEKITREDTNLKFTILLAQPPIQELLPHRPGWKYQIIGPRPLWTQIGEPLHLFWHQSEYDVLFSPGHYAPGVCPIPYVTTVMDLAYLHFPQQFRKNDLLQLKEWTKASVKKAKKVIVISDFTKQDVIKHYRKSSQDIVVAYPSLASSNHQNDNVNRKIFSKFNITQPYFIYVGTIQPRKNLVNLVEAFESVSRYWESSRVKTKTEAKRHKSSESRPLQLVIAGKIGWLADEFLARVAQSPFSDRIKIIGYVSDREKQVLYENAVANILIGLYEGFGIPPLESMAVGTPAIVSNNTSLPEVVGKAGILVNPNLPQSIAQGMKKALIMPAKQKAQLRKEMKEQVKKFDWQKSAQLILNTLRQVADES